MGKPDFRRLNTRIAYPWPVDAEMPQDVTGIGIDEIIYGNPQISEFTVNEGNYDE